jgi:hypothetical protein
MWHGFNHRSINAGSVLDKVATEQTFSKYFRFRCHFSFIIRNWYDEPFKAKVPKDSVSSYLRITKLIKQKNNKIQINGSLPYKIATKSVKVFLVYTYMKYFIHGLTQIEFY